MEVSFAQDFDPADDYPNSDSYESSSGIEELGEEEDDFEFAHKQTRSKSKAKSDILPEEFPDPEEFEFKTSKNIAQLKVHGGAGDGKVGKSRSMEFTNIFKKNYRSKRNSLTMKPTTNLLLVKESGKRFRRRWVFLTDTSIRCYRTQVEDPDKPPVLEIPLICAAVKHKEDRPTLFFILNSSSLTKYIFQAETEQMAREWIANINSVCEKLVMESINVPESQQQETHDPLDTLTERDVEQILDGRTCADCGAPDPGWVSVNIGSFICMECSGVHRSFGTHISQIRSVQFDFWTPEQIEQLKNMDNDKVNEVWEYSIHGNHEKITESATRKQRHDFLHAKYVVGLFRADYVSPVTCFSPTSTTKEKTRSLMLDSLKNDDEFRLEFRRLLFDL